jgi:hypothetical protein
LILLNNHMSGTACTVKLAVLATCGYVIGLAFS